MFDDSNPLGEAILGKLSDVIYHHSEGRVLPSYIERIKDNFSVDVGGSRAAVKATLGNMVVSMLKGTILMSFANLANCQVNQNL